MSDLISRCGLKPEKDDPEPDPRSDPVAWIKWFRRLTGLGLTLAVPARNIRQKEWDDLETSTK